MDWIGEKLDDNAPWPRLADGETVPHQVETAEVAELWAAGQRRARVRQRIGQLIFIACCVLVPLLIVAGSVQHH